MMESTTAPNSHARTEQLAIDVLEEACRQEVRIATAESCTGGALAALLTDVENMSHAFDRGFVTYTEEAKCDLLGIDKALVDAHGAVSREVALAMARGALGHSDAQLAVSITGYAGPAGDGGEEGLVHLAAIRAGGREWHREEHFGEQGRDGVRAAALAVALTMMNNALLNG